MGENTDSGADQSVEKEPQKVKPSWLQDFQETAPETQTTQFAQGSEPQYMRQPPPQQPQRYDNEAEVRRFAADPKGYLQEAMAPLINQLRSKEQQEVHRNVQRTNEEARRASNYINQAYDQILNEDKAFRGNPQIRQETETVLKTFYNDALNKAKRTGDVSDLQAMQDPHMYRMALAAARMRNGYPFSYEPPKQQPQHFTEYGGRNHPSANDPATAKIYGQYGEETVDRLRGLGISAEDLAKAQQKARELRNR